MKFLLRPLLMTILLFGGFPNVKSETNQNPKLEIPTEKVVVLEMEFPVMEDIFTGELFKPTGLCTGFFIGSNNQIMTAAHCVDGIVMSVAVKTHDGSRYKAEILYISKTSDVALIKISTTTQYPHFTVAKSVTQGEKVYTLGHPLRKVYTLTHGIIANVLEKETKKTLVDMTLLPGNSGGPVYNEKGELVGVASAGYIVMLGTTGLNLIASLSQVTEFLDLFKGL